MAGISREKLSIFFFYHTYKQNLVEIKIDYFHEKGNKIPVIVITADIQDSKKQRCMELGAVAFINKVISKTELEETLTKII